MKPDDPSVLYVGSDHRTIYNNHQAQVWKLWNVNDTAVGNILSIRLDKFFPRYELASDTLHSIYTEQYAIAVTPADAEAIYIACTAFPYNNASNNQLNIFKYENNQWVRKFRCNCNDGYGPFGGCGYNKLQLLVSPTDTTVVYVGGNTFDKLVNWVDVTHTSYYFNGQNGYHPDTRFAVILQGTASPNTNGINDVIFAGNDGGISKTVNGIQSWINLDGPGLYITQFYGIGGANKNPDWIGGGSQDNSFFKLGLFRWEHTG